MSTNTWKAFDTPHDPCNLMGQLLSYIQYLVAVTKQIQVSNEVYSGNNEEQQPVKN